MSTRRPRVKAAVVFKPRRPQASNESSGDNAIQPKTEVENTINISNGDPKDVDAEETSPQLSVTSSPELQVDTKPTISDIVIVKSPNNQQSSSVSDSVENRPPTDAGSSKVVLKPSNASVMPTPFRRISTPPVNVVNRRKSLIATDNRPSFGSPKYIKSPSYSFVRDAPPKDSKSNASTTHHSANTKPTNGDDELFSPAPIENDECFKSPPFMSPIYTRRIEPSMSPFHDIYGDDYTKSPSQLPNNTKIRQRIRPTPCFASRRNSIQGSGLGGASESEDEQHRRQRHYSTSSNHSSYNPASTPQYQRNYFGLNKIPSRVRTESYSSSISDIPFSKNKRSHRSEEYQRVANAKREFNQRLNGQPPDKSRLTMYDLIYYNPLTNPMSKPAGKGDKNSDTASVSSAKTNQSRGSSHSVKSEASVKTEKSETLTDTVTGPVPQLKLDANGEIILDEKSLVIETTGNKEAREMLANTDVVYDDEFSGTSGFYKRQKRTRDWLPLETLKFYRSLQTIGTDFSVMLQLFPNRSRRDLKLKFKKEEKHNMALINKALLHPKEFNVDELKLQFDKEDEEIEQKKQEWAEVRKKMATERREQLNVTKKRNPNRQLSRSVRSLTVGDMVYENEFVSLPPKSKRNRKPDVVADLLDGAMKNPPDDSVFSPPSLNHNNNHVDTLPQHTYATHKLPSFIEMMSSQKLRPNSSPKTPSLNPNPTPIEYTSPISKHEMNNTPANIESNGTFDDEEDESVHAMDLSTTSGSLVVHGAKSTDPIEERNNGNNVQLTGNESTIGQYIAKNPNLTFKGSGDIMNMDIIFENVSIEEDTSIGNATKTPESVKNRIESIQESPTEEHVSIDNVTESQVEHVHIDGVHYQIITIENANDKDEHLGGADQESDEEAAIVNNLPAFVEEVATTESVIDNITIPVIDQDPLNSSPMLNKTVILSSVDVASEVETGEVVDTAADPVSTNDILPSNTPKIKPESSNNESDVGSSTSTIKEESLSQSTVQSAESSANVKAVPRKRKAVPLLANNKRTRRSNANYVADTKVEQPEQQEQAEHSNIPSDHLGGKTVEPKNEIKTNPIIEASLNIDAAHDEQVDEQTLETHETDNQMEEEAQIDTDTSERSFLDSLVVVESQDPNNSSRTIHEVYVVDPETKEMSEKPLDLPEHVIQRIRLAIS